MNGWMDDTFRLDWMNGNQVSQSKSMHGIYSLTDESMVDGWTDERKKKDLI